MTIKSMEKIMMYFISTLLTYLICLLDILFYLYAIMLTWIVRLVHNLRNMFNTIKGTENFLKRYKDPRTF